MFWQFPGPPESMQTCVVWRGRGCGGKTESGRAAVGLASVHGQEILVNKEANTGSGARPQTENY